MSYQNPEKTSGCFQLVMGITPIAGWFIYNGKSENNMDDDWEYPHFRKPPYEVFSPYVF